MGRRADDETLHLLRVIDTKLDRLLSQLTGAGDRVLEGAPAAGREDLAAKAAAIAALTPLGVRQSDTVAMLRQDRDR